MYIDDVNKSETYIKHVSILIIEIIVLNAT